MTHAKPKPVKPPDRMSWWRSNRAGRSGCPAVTRHVLSRAGRQLRSLSPVALQPAHGVIGELKRIAAAHEHPQGTLSLTFIGGRDAPSATATQHGDRGLQLVLGPAPAQRRLDQLRGDAEVEQAALDAQGPPSVEGATVHGEALDVASVVEVALILKLGHRRPRVGLPHSVPSKMLKDLGDGPVALAQMAVGQLQGALAVVDVLLGIGAGAQAARSPAGTASITGAMSSLGGSMGVTRSRPRPSAA